MEWNGCGHWLLRGHESGIMDLAQLNGSMLGLGRAAHIELDRSAGSASLMD